MKRRGQGSKDNEYDLCLKLEENKEVLNSLNQRVRKLEQEILTTKQESAVVIESYRLALVNSSIQQEEAVRSATDTIRSEYKDKFEQLGNISQHDSKFHQKD